MSRRGRWMLAGALGALLLGLVLWAAAGVMLRHQPRFYVAASQASAAERDAAGIELEKELLDLHNQVRRGGTWQARLEEREVNGWLAADLPSKLPQLLPPEVSDPCVAFRGDAVLLAFRYRQDEWDVVVSAELDLQTTDTPNEVAIRIDQAKIGALPLPLSKIMQRLSDASRSSGVPLQWRQQNGRPVALVTLDLKQPQAPHRPLLLERIMTGDGHLDVEGAVR